VNIETFNQLQSAQKQAELFKCCGSTAWSEALAKIPSFNTLDELKKESDRIWFSLSEKDWKEAFTHHPKIGEIEDLKKKFSLTADWASDEQSKVSEAGEGILAALKENNDAYENKFGFIFIVYAAGKSAGEMLGLLKKRLINNPAFERRVAAEEQNKITHLRLDKLFA
jgi:2-oxo-4-hydroxy-4-carboxy-5-ureidoimidazoline decarboxylase